MYGPFISISFYYWWVCAPGDSNLSLETIKFVDIGKNYGYTELCDEDDGFMFYWFEIADATFLSENY